MGEYAEMSASDSFWGYCEDWGNPDSRDPYDPDGQTITGRRGQKLPMDYVFKKDIPIIAQTEKEVLATYRGYDLWFPKSHIEHDEKRIISITAWLFAKKMRREKNVI
jgi:hypothetical protein